MLVKQDTFIDEKNRFHVVNKYDHSVGAEVARMLEKEGGGRGSLGKNGVEFRSMGFIPCEMFMYDPWLIEAQKAQRAGDMGEYTKLMQKFFEVHREFAPLIPKKYY